MSLLTRRFHCSSWTLDGRDPVESELGEDGRITWIQKHSSPEPNSTRKEVHNQEDLRGTLFQIYVLQLTHMS